MEEHYTEEYIGEIAGRILAQISPSDEGAVVVALKGDLGAGKTTLTKALAQKLGITETVVSPTFVIAKFYQPTLQTKGVPVFDRVMHIDAYRIEDERELIPLGWQEVLEEPRTLIIVEWPERINHSLPAHHHLFSITGDGDKRLIKKVS